MGVIVMNEETIRRAKTFFEQDYRERGKIKWNGFFLSDHTQKINHTKKDQAQAINWLEETAICDMQAACREAFANHRTILFQLDSTTTDQQAPAAITAFVSAFNESGFWIDKIYYRFETIHHLEVKHEH